MQKESQNPVTAKIIRIYVKLYLSNNVISIKSAKHEEHNSPFCIKLD